MIASLKSALHDALSLARGLRLAAARVKAAEARADAAEAAEKLTAERFSVLATMHARTLAGRQDDRRRHERDIAEEHEQAQRAIRDRDRAEDALAAMRADIDEARRLAKTGPMGGARDIALLLVESDALALGQREELRARLLETRAALDAHDADLADARRLIGLVTGSAVDMVRWMRQASDKLLEARLRAEQERDSAQQVADQRMAALEEVRKQRDVYRDERDAARGSLASALADIDEARRLADAAPQASPQAIVGALMADVGREASNARAARSESRQWLDELIEARHQRDEARAEAERLSAELRAAKSQGGGRS